MLSVIVPFYNETAFLRAALRSVRNQGLDDVELIVVNDNPDAFGRDDLAALTDGFGARVIHHLENRGLSAARNTGITAANGTHIAFLDADDYYTPGGLAAQLAYAHETGADITHAACYLGAESSVHTKVLHRDARLHLSRRVVDGRMTAQEAQFIVSSWSSVYRAEFLADNDLWFDPEQRKFEDRLFVLHAVTAARRIAFLGQPVRVWRRRAGSISSQATTAETHLLQVQLLEKCMDHMRAQDLPLRFEKRELFNTVSRLIWDMDILPYLAAGDVDYADMAARIPALLGDDSFGHDIFADPMVSATSRVGMRTRHGLINRARFFALHKAWRTGDYVKAQRLMDECAPRPAPLPARDQPQRRLVLHIGLHKTGTTFVQHHLLHHRDALARAGVLVPETGFDRAVPGRRGALSGHQGLVRALRDGDDALWRAFHDEVSASPARTVVLSAENLSFPTEPDRDARIAQLFQRLGTWANIDVIAALRAPHAYIEAFHAEWVASAHPGGARSLPEMLVDHADRLTDMPALFAPFEAATGHPVTLYDFDAARRDDGVWASFASAAGLPALPTTDAPQYPTPDRDSVRLLQMVNVLVANQARRRTLLDTYFAAPPVGGTRHSLLSPDRRAEIVADFAERSDDFCAARGYAPDMNAWRAALANEDWVPPGPIPGDCLDVLTDVGVQVAGDVDAPAPLRTPASAPAKGPPRTGRNRYAFVIRPRPWLVRLLDRLLLKED
ncbi:glycosyltransferase family 2 protein [uncultured Tateyamaria sp.]|uniref:glycosyltransferase family 2 protein n=1 Tax=Tateyamaria sp. 1078 TaxID=3417464 RepID=UPI002621301E|nr:glycosyltransferase family 2 protein [uncultured Tateyamaria sp.]